MTKYRIGEILALAEQLCIRSPLIKLCIHEKNVFIILENPIELWMSKNKFGEIFSSSGTTLYKIPSDQTVVD